MTDTTHVETIVIGAGQAGLATGYHLARREPSVPDPGCARPGRGRLAEPVRLAAALQPGQVRRPARLGDPGQGLVLADQGRGGRLPRGLRGPVLAAGAHRDGRRLAVPRRGRLRRDLGGAPVHRGQRRGGLRHLAGAEDARLRRPAGPGDRPAALERLPQSRPAATRCRAGGRRQSLRRRHRPRGSRPTARPPLRADPRAGPVRHRGTRWPAGSSR